MASKTPSATTPIGTPSIIPSVVGNPNAFQSFYAWLHKHKVVTGLFFFTPYYLLSLFANLANRIMKPLYVIKELELNPDQARTLIHTTTAVGFFVPLFGAIIAESWMGRYRAIAIFTPFSIIAYILLTLSAISPLHLRPALYYFIISSALNIMGSMFEGTCALPFAGDQFVEGKDEQRRKYFSALYITFNVLAMIALIVYPALRVKFGGCFGSQYCYPLPFGVGGGVAIIAAIFFYCGTPFYILIPPSVTVMKNFAKCVWVAIRQRFRDGTKREHWLDRADVRFSPEFISDVKSIFALIVLFLPLPVYYSLYEQMETSWTVQSDLLDGRVTDVYEILPDSMDIVNTIVVIILIPLFDYVLYPLLGKFNILKTPLQRMCTGGFCCAIAFFLCALLNRQIEKEYPFPPSEGYADLMMINSVECDIDIHYQNKIYSIASYQYLKFSEIPIADDTFTVVTSSSCPTESEEKFTQVLVSATVYTVVFALNNDANMTMTSAVQRRERNLQSNTVMRFIYLDQLPQPDAFLLVESEYGDDIFYLTDGFSEYLTVVKFTKYSLCWARNITKGTNKVANCYGNKISTFELYKGAIIDTLLIYNNETQTTNLKMMFAYPEDHISILYQLPQYIALTTGEVLLEVTAMSFNYVEAPVTLKAVVNAMWLLTRALGNLLIVLIVQIKVLAGIEKDSTALFAFATVMLMDVTIFCYISHRYKYKSHTIIVKS